jgi:hypothetical protein
MTPRFLLAVALSIATIAPCAQEPDASVDPVVASFREFRAALERGDAAAAEAAAQRGLEASERVNGPKTAVLALNLATVRLDRGQAAAAYAPARRAHELATSDAALGVDPVLTALTLGRAELAVDRTAAAARLLEAMAEAQRRGAWQAETYSGAVELARASFAAADYEAARAAWAVAARLAPGSADDSNVERGVARTGEGAALFMRALAQSPRQPGPAGTLIARIDSASARDAGAAFAEALDLLQPFSGAAGQGALTLAQRGYAEALAWEGALRAKMQSQGDDLPRAERAAAASGRCSVRLVPDPAPDYPSGALLGSGFGAVVMRVRTDGRGAIVDRQIAAAIPAGSFSEAVAAVADEWRVEVLDAASGCRLDGIQYTPILFVADAAAPEPPPGGLIDEIIVRGQTPPALRLEIERAENAVFERFNAINSDDELDIRCTLETPTGTHMPQRVCAPVFYRDAQAHAGEDTTRAFQGLSSGVNTEQYYAGLARYRYTQLEDEMRRLAGEDRDLLDALQRLLELRQTAKDAASAKRGD